MGAIVYRQINGQQHILSKSVLLAENRFKKSSGYEQLFARTLPPSRFGVYITILKNTYLTKQLPLQGDMKSLGY